MNERNEKLQSKVLNTLRKEKKEVTIFFMNGFQMKGFIKAFDEFCVIVHANGKDQMVYKHAISTISSDVSLSSAPKGEDTAEERT